MADKKDRKPEAALQGFGQGASFGFLDELKGLAAATGTTLPALLTVLEGENPFTNREAFDDVVERLYGIPAEQFLTQEGYRTARDTSRKEQKSLREQHPVTYALSELAGGISTPIPGAAPAKGASLGAKLGKGALVGAGIGAASGAGNSDSNSLEGILSDSAFGSLFGSAAGAGGAYAGDKLSRFLQPLIKDASRKMTGISDPRLADLAIERGALEGADLMTPSAQSELQKRLFGAADSVAGDVAKARKTIATMDAPTMETRNTLNNLINKQMKAAKESPAGSRDVLTGIQEGIEDFSPNTKTVLDEVNSMVQTPGGYSKMGPTVSESPAAKALFERLFGELPEGQRFSYGSQEKMRQQLDSLAKSGDTTARPLRSSLDEGLTDARAREAMNALGPTSQHVLMDKKLGPATRSALELWGPKSSVPNPERQAASLAKFSDVYNELPRKFVNQAEKRATDALKDVRALEAAANTTKGIPLSANAQREALLLGEALGESLPQLRSREVNQFKQMLDRLGLSEDEE